MTQPDPRHDFVTGNTVDDRLCAYCGSPAFDLVHIVPRCYHPQLSHASCPAGHPVHLDVDHYDEPTWVHCLIRDVVACPHDYEDITGAALPGKHRVQS